MQTVRGLNIFGAGFHRTITDWKQNRFHKLLFGTFLVIQLYYLVAFPNCTHLLRNDDDERVARSRYCHIYALRILQEAHPSGADHGENNSLVLAGLRLVDRKRCGLTQQNKTM